MSSICISDLRPAGAELFQDSETFLHELSDSELSIMGGRGGRGRGGGGLRSLVNINIGPITFNSIFITNTANANTIGNNNGGWF